MKKLALLLLVTLLSLNLFSQMQIPNLVFVFQNQNVFTSQFADKDHSKQFSFSVEGLENQTDAQALIHNVEQARGVEEFKLEPTSTAGQYSAKLKVYKYANGWWYWKTFMQKTGIPIFRIENQNYTATSITNLQ